MTRVWFIVPVHGRQALTSICLRLLRQTCDQLDHLEATAVVIGDDANVDLADELGFATVRRDNQQLGRKFNDGYQLACDPDYNPEPADYVIPFGSDDWIDPAALRQMPGAPVGIFERIAVVNEDRTQIAQMRATHLGGCGVRVIPRQMIEPFGYRPADEDRNAGIDFSVYRRIQPKAVRLLDVHPFQIVDWKTHGEQLHSYRSVRCARRRIENDDPFAVLAGIYPAWALDEVRELTAMPVAA